MESAMTRSLARLLQATSLLFALMPWSRADASLGMFEHGNGIASMGMGGVSYSYAEETTALGANPAHALALGDRWDLGVDFFSAEAEAIYDGNAAGPDKGYKSDGRAYYSIPQGGYSKRLSDRWALGVTMLNAGLGPDYDGSPYERFGGGHRGTLSLTSSSFVTALAYQVAPKHAVGISLNTGYQVLSVQGLQFLADPGTSSAPDHVTNQGRDGAFNVGFSVGWHGQLTPWLGAGLGYRSKNLTQPHDDYRGLIAEHGKLELPAIYGGGFTLTPMSAWTLSVEAQRYAYRKQRAFRNGIGRLASARLGDDDGPGFGFHDQNAYKLGLRWQATPSLALRAGYIWATQIIDEGETLFGAFGSLAVTDQVTAGATWTRRGWEWSAYGFNAPEQRVRGRDSIPADLGGGEIDNTHWIYGIGFSLGRRFAGI